MAGTERDWLLVQAPCTYRPETQVCFGDDGVIPHGNIQIYVLVKICGIKKKQTLVELYTKNDGFYLPFFLILSQIKIKGKNAM